MKKLNYSLVLIFVAFLFSCAKDDGITKGTDSTVNAGNQSQDYLSITQDDYNSLVNSIDKDFQEAFQQYQITKLEPQKGKQPTTMPEPETVDMNQFIQKQKSILNSYPQLDHFTSALDIYHQALLMDKSQVKAFVKKYSDFMTLIEEVNFPMLTISKGKAAIINPNGIIKVEGKILQYKKSTLKIIEDGDPAKISLLDNTNSSTDDITVHEVKLTKNNQNGDKATRLISSTGYIVNSSYSVFSLSYVDYVDYHHLVGYQQSTPILQYRIGSEVAVFFNGQLHYASAINLLTSANSFNAANCWSETFINGTSNGTGFVNAWGGYTSISINAYCVSSSHTGSVSASFDTGFAITYANGYIWSGLIP